MADQDLVALQERLQQAVDVMRAARDAINLHENDVPKQQAILRLTINQLAHLNDLLLAADEAAAALARLGTIQAERDEWKHDEGCARRMWKQAEARAAAAEQQRHALAEASRELIVKWRLWDREAEASDFGICADELEARLGTIQAEPVRTGCDDCLEARRTAEAQLAAALARLGTIQAESERRLEWLEALGIWRQRAEAAEQQHHALAEALRQLQRVHRASADETPSEWRKCRVCGEDVGWPCEEEAIAGGWPSEAICEGCVVEAALQASPAAPSPQRINMDDQRIGQLARSYADTIGAALERAGGRYNYGDAAHQLRRLIEQVLEEQRREVGASPAAPQEEKP